MSPGRPLPRPLLAVAAALCAAVGLVPNRAEGLLSGAQQGDPVPAPSPTIVAENVLLRDALTRNAAAMGGEERLDALRAVRFTVHAESLGDDGEWTQAPAVTFAFQRRGEYRFRIDDHHEGRPIVKLGRASAVRVFVDGQPTALPELLQGARFESAAVGELVEMWLGMTSGRLLIADEGRRKRDGREVHAMRVRAAGEGSGRVLQLFLDAETGLASRLDEYDPNTGLRHQTTRFLEWPQAREPKLPARVEMSARDGVVRVRWQIRDVAFDPELPDGYFERP
jgi:hypothetical protein